MKEESEKNNIIKDNKSFKAFNIIKDIQNLIKKESNFKKLCKLLALFIFTFSSY